MSESNTNIGIELKDFEKLFKDNFKVLCAFAYKFIKDMDTSKEIVHDVFVKLWEKRSEIDQSKSVRSLLFTMVNNKSLNWIRDNKKFSSNEMNELTAGIDSFDGQDSMEYKEMEAKVKSVINELPEKCREVFLMSRYEGLKYKEIADKLNISIKTVENQMGKALKVLRENLKEYILVLFLIWFHMQ